MGLSTDAASNTTGSSGMLTEMAHLRERRYTRLRSAQAEPWRSRSPILKPPPGRPTNRTDQVQLPIAVEVDVDGDWRFALQEATDA